MDLELTQARDLATRLADVAGTVALKYFRGPLDIEAKVDFSPVTIADREAEQAIRDLITQVYPEHGILGEELGDSRIDADYVWAIDPIDGTTSFVTGNPLFGTLVSLLRHGVPVIGIIDMPALDERWIGCEGLATTFDGRERHTRSCADLKDAWLSATSPQMFPTDEFSRFEALRQRCRRTVYGTDCYAYGLLANGTLDLVVEATMGIYDFCALAPVVTGAGGTMTDWQGQPLTIKSDGRVVAAGDIRMHRAALNILSVHNQDTIS